jgi:hypothetical protein
VIDTPEAETRVLELGFSHRAVVYLTGGRSTVATTRTAPGTIASSGGSIGWYDELYLPLEAGENELVIAVSEDLGGWGLQARLG